jgi:hypothetical protein
MDSELSLTDKPEVANQAGLDNDYSRLATLGSPRLVGQENRKATHGIEVSFYRC